MKLLTEDETAAYSVYVRISDSRQMPKELAKIISNKLCLAPLPANLQSNSYFEAARSGQNRSILDVCEDFARKADAERALLCGFAKK